MGLVQSNISAIAKLYQVDDLEDRVHELYRKKMSAEAKRRKDLALAFSLGGAGLLVFFAFGLFRKSHAASKPTRSSRRVSTSERSNPAVVPLTPCASHDVLDDAMEGETEDERCYWRN
jgi:hypothetical protein